MHEVTNINQIIGIPNTMVNGNHTTERYPLANRRRINISVKKKEKKKTIIVQYNVIYTFTIQISRICIILVNKRIR